MPDSQNSKVKERKGIFLDGQKNKESFLFFKLTEEKRYDFCQMFLSKKSRHEQIFFID